MDQTALSLAISNMNKEKTPESQRAFSDTIRKLINDKREVWIAVRDTENFTLGACAVEMQNMKLLVVFSEMQYAKADSGVSIIGISLGKLLVSARNLEGFDGVTINPFTPDCRCVITKNLIESIITGVI